MSIALLLSFLLALPATPAEPGQGLSVSTDPIVLTLPGYPWGELSANLGLYSTHGARFIGVGESQRVGDTWTGRVVAGEQRWLTFTNRSSWVSIESLVRVCVALADLEDVGLDLTNRNCTDAELAALARAHPRLFGLMLRDAAFVPWEQSFGSLVPFARSLRSLVLDVYSLDDAAIATMLAPLVRLERVSVLGASGAATLEHLGELEHLRSVRLEGSRANPEDLARLLARGRVQELFVLGHPRHWPASGWSEVLAAAGSLKRLALDAQHLTEDVVEAILALPALESIELDGNFQHASRGEELLSGLLSRPWKGLQLPGIARLDTELVARIAAMPELEWLDVRQVGQLDLQLLAPLSGARSLRLLHVLRQPADDRAPIRRLLEANEQLIVPGDW